ncbi:class I SAM-dependent methyltransferase [Paenibacillus sp. MMS18-CY102]|uniref:class I SAM-dependent methyltransferase n=1 Tax=Paenibacillus sp. MMS18-CY102 TaxID=2682849 RepID=UPI00136672EE|nr:class I SAM-dependent methyltransferase [Paenibacillus sp. MMS18-CY102]MWC30987.1 methyltransferase domain-containing protein [Paenibacillus sp. MMS18-CY102]
MSDATQYANTGKFNARVELHARFSTNAYPWPRWVRDQIEAPDQADVLELGCGTGLLWLANADRIPAGWQVTLSDFSEGMLSGTAAALAAVEHPFRYEQMDASQIPHPDASFDIIIANHMLYHIEDRQQALREIARVLRPGGILCASTIGSGNMKEVKSLMRDFNSGSNYEVALGTVSERFSLDNGAEQIGQVFAHVETRLYANTLHVTDPEAIVRYLLSVNGLIAGAIALPPEQVESFSAFLQSRLNADGSFDISTESGLFIARND